MESLSLLDDISLMVLASIVISIVLAFVLVVVIFSVKFKSHQEKNIQLRERLEEKIVKVSLLEESLNEVRILNSSQLQELGQQNTIKEQYQSEIEKLSKELEVANEKIEKGNRQILMIEKDKSELGANMNNAKESLAKSEEALLVASKRNEFWVEQMAEMRVKYDALRLKLK